MTAADHLDSGNRLGAEVIDVGQLNAFGEHPVDTPRPGELLAAPAARREPAHVSTALQPDRTEVAVDVAQSRRRAYLGIEPEGSAVSVDESHVDQRLWLAGAGTADLFLPPGTRSQMSSHA